MKMKKVFNKLFAFALAVTLIISASICSYAESGQYGSFYLTYTCSVSATKGTATTSGATNPYYNCAIITVYKNGTSKGNACGYKKQAKATATKSGVGLTKAYSCHSVTDANKKQLLSFNQQKTLTKYRQYLSCCMM